MFGLGISNFGKSTLVEACQVPFGEYAGNFNAESLPYCDSKVMKLQFYFDFVKNTYFLK